MTRTDFWIVHGLLGALAVFVVYPLGILQRRISIGPSWLSHSTIQILGLVLNLSAAGIGLLLSRSISRMHQWSGLSMILMALAQVFGGLLMKDLSIDSRAKRYSRLLHGVNGLLCLAVGWFTFVTGMVLASWNSDLIIVFALSTAVEIAAIPALSIMASSGFEATAALHVPSRPSSYNDGDDCEHGNEEEKQ